MCTQLDQCEYCGHEPICSLKKIFAAYNSALKKCEEDSLKLINDCTLNSLAEKNFFTSVKCELFIGKQRKS